MHSLIPNALQSKEELIKRLKSTTKTLNDFIASTSRLTERHEDLRGTIAFHKGSLAAQATELNNKQTLLARSKADKQKLVEQLKQSNIRLEESRAALKNGTPDQAKYADAITRCETLQKSLDEATRKNEEKEHELNFTRTQYQQASNATYSLRKEVEQLESLNEELTRKANGRVVELQELRIKEKEMKGGKEKEVLEGKVRERDARIQKLEEEKKARLSAGRLGTRMGSVPRRNSPAASRASSPVTGNSRWGPAV